VLLRLPSTSLRMPLPRDDGEAVASLLTILSLNKNKRADLGSLHGIIKETKPRLVFLQEVSSFNAVSALASVFKLHLNRLHPPPGWDRLHYSHPVLPFCHGTRNPPRDGPAGHSRWPPLLSPTCPFPWPAFCLSQPPYSSGLPYCPYTYRRLQLFPKTD